MDRLLSLLSTTQSALKQVGMKMDTPVIAVVGCQSSGKSSVLESIINLDVLPKQAGLCTRVPLELTLIHDPHKHTAAGAFKHLSEGENTKFNTPDEDQNLKNMRDEIWKRTNECTNPNEIKDIPIFLEIRSSKVSNLILVDLPGVTKISVGQQNSDIVGVINALVTRYIKPSKTIILAVSPANMDLANSDSLSMARQVDPEGKRTVGVLTKIDIMDQGTDCLNVLNNEVHPLALGYIGVKNRSQADLKAGLSLAESKNKEEEFFRNSSIYRGLASELGSRFLTEKVSRLLVERVKDQLPAIQNDISTKANEIRTDLEATGASFANSSLLDKKKFINECIRYYSDNISGSLEGRFRRDSLNYNDDEDLGEKIQKEQEAQKKKVSVNYGSRIDGNLALKKTLGYHNRYVVHNNGTMNLYKSATNLNNPRTYSLADYDVIESSDKKESFYLVSASEKILFKTPSSNDKDKWVATMNKGRAFLEATGRKLFVDVKGRENNKMAAEKTTSNEGKKSTDGGKKSRKTKKNASSLAGMSEALLKTEGGESKAVGSFIRVTYLNFFVPAIENCAPGDVSENSFAYKNAKGLNFLPESMLIGSCFKNMVSKITCKLLPISENFLEKVRRVFEKTIEDTLPEKVKGFNSLNAYLLSLARDLLEECTITMAKEIKYESELYSDYIYCNKKSFLDKLPERPVLTDYLNSYFDDYKVHIVDFVWKLIMVFLVQRFNKDFKDLANYKANYLQPDEIERLFEQDPAEMNRRKKLEKTLSDLERVSAELSTIILE